eukprot:scaffold35856_cov144-Skeletonema_dohrnii-CCMP3373.AAC.3
MRNWASTCMWVHFSKTCVSTPFASELGIHIKGMGRQPGISKLDEIRSSVHCSGTNMTYTSLIGLPWRRKRVYNCL